MIQRLGHSTISYNCCTHACAGRKNATETIIPKIYNSGKNEVLGNVIQQSIIGSTQTDGWRKMAAAQGTPLINVNLTKPDGGAVFVKVNQICQDIAQLLHSQSSQVTT
jgi:hypothetical protein